MKVALVEAGHWHAPLYLDGLRGEDVQIIAVSDATQSERAHDIANQFGATFYASTSELLEREKLDFIFAFGRHIDMPSIAHAIMDAGIPFSLEKPCGIAHADVEGLAKRAAAEALYVAVPFIYRVSALVDIFSSLERGLPSRFSHLSFRFIAGAPSRYETAGCEWMLDPALAGGGATANVGIHFLDLFRFLTGEEAVTVSALTSHATHNAQVEDFAAITIAGSGGAIATIETGYTYPSRMGDQREFTMTARSADHYVRTVEDGLRVSTTREPLSPSRTFSFERENDLYYPIYARRVLSEVAAHKAPHCGLEEAAAAMRILEAVYASARTGGTPISLPAN